jgi:hypothetical protein
VPASDHFAAAQFLDYLEALDDVSPYQRMVIAGGGGRSDAFAFSMAQQYFALALFKCLDSLVDLRRCIGVKITGD